MGSRVWPVEEPYHRYAAYVLALETDWRRWHPPSGDWIRPEPTEADTASRTRMPALAELERQVRVRGCWQSSCTTCGGLWGRMGEAVLDACRAAARDPETLSREVYGALTEGPPAWVLWKPLLVGAIEGLWEERPELLGRIIGPLVARYGGDVLLWLLAPVLLLRRPARGPGAGPRPQLEIPPEVRAAWARTLRGAREAHDTIESTRASLVREWLRRGRERSLVGADPLLVDLALETLGVDEVLANRAWLVDPLLAPSAWAERLRRRLFDLGDARAGVALLAMGLPDPADRGRVAGHLVQLAEAAPRVVVDALEALPRSDPGIARLLPLLGPCVCASTLVEVDRLATAVSRQVPDQVAELVQCAERRAIDTADVRWLEWAITRARSWRPGDVARMVGAWIEMVVEEVRAAAPRSRASGAPGDWLDQRLRFLAEAAPARRGDLAQGLAALVRGPDRADLAEWLLGRLAPCLEGNQREAVVQVLADRVHDRPWTRTRDRQGSLETLLAAVVPAGDPRLARLPLVDVRKPSPGELDAMLEALRAAWVEICGPELGAATRPGRFRGKRARRLEVVVLDPAFTPPWGAWNSLLLPSAFSRFRGSVNDRIAPHHVDHVDFVRETGS